MRDWLDGGCKMSTFLIGHGDVWHKTLIIGTPKFLLREGFASQACQDLRSAPRWWSGVEA